MAVVWGDQAAYCKLSLFLSPCLKDLNRNFYSEGFRRCTTYVGGLKLEILEKPGSLTYWRNSG